MNLAELQALCPAIWSSYVKLQINDEYMQASLGKYCDPKVLNKELLFYESFKKFLNLFI